MDQFDLWQAVPKQVFMPYSLLLISTAFVVVSHIGCLWITSVQHYTSVELLLSSLIMLCWNFQNGDKVCTLKKFGIDQTAGVCCSFCKGIKIWQFLCIIMITEFLSNFFMKVLPLIC